MGVTLPSIMVCGSATLLSLNSSRTDVPVRVMASGSSSRFLTSAFHGIPEAAAATLPATRYIRFEYPNLLLSAKSGLRNRSREKTVSSALSEPYHRRSPLWVARPVRCDRRSRTVRPSVPHSSRSRNHGSRRETVSSHERIPSLTSSPMAVAVNGVEAGPMANTVLPSTRLPSPLLHTPYPRHSTTESSLTMATDAPGTRHAARQVRTHESSDPAGAEAPATGAVRHRSNNGRIRGAFIIASLTVLARTAAREQECPLRHHPPLLRTL